MKRSKINAVIKDMEKLIKEHGFEIPPFCNWTPEDWKTKNHEYDDWYKENLSGDTGIWVGNGASDQFLITINSTSSDIINNCGQSFGYVINQGEPNLVKLVGMKERGEEYG